MSRHRLPHRVGLGGVEDLVDERLLGLGVTAGAETGHHRDHGVGWIGIAHPVVVRTIARVRTPPWGRCRW